MYQEMYQDLYQGIQVSRYRKLSSMDFGWRVRCMAKSCLFAGERLIRSAYRMMV